MLEFSSNNDKTKTNIVKKNMYKITHTHTQNYYQLLFLLIIWLRLI